jgi:hypothetical protein
LCFGGCGQFSAAHGAQPTLGSPGIITSPLTYRRKRDRSLSHQRPMIAAGDETMLRSIRVPRESPCPGEPGGRRQAHARRTRHRPVTARRPVRRASRMNRRERSMLPMTSWRLVSAFQAAKLDRVIMWRGVVLLHGRLPVTIAPRATRIQRNGARENVSGSAHRVGYCCDRNHRAWSDWLCWGMVWG